MKQITYTITTAVFALFLTLSSCSKFDWKPWKDSCGKFPIVLSDCDVQRVYTLGEGGSTDVQMQKTYDAYGRTKTVAFYTHSAVSPDQTWHSFTLNYNTSDGTVDIIDSARGAAVLRAIFNHSGRLERLQRLQGDTSSFADRRFEYAGGRLITINSEWRTFNFVDSFNYDVNGNIVRRATADASGVTVEAIFTYGAAASDKKQFYIPNFNYMIVIDPSMALLEYLRWIKDFSPKNILTRIEYLNPLPGEDTYSAHVFDTGGKLTSYSNGDYVGGTKYIDWRCDGPPKK